MNHGFLNYIRQNQHSHQRVVFHSHLQKVEQQEQEKEEMRRVYGSPKPEQGPEATRWTHQGIPKDRERRTSEGRRNSGRNTPNREGRVDPSPTAGRASPPSTPPHTPPASPRTPPQPSNRVRPITLRFVFLPARLTAAGRRNLAHGNQLRPCLTRHQQAAAHRTSHWEGRPEAEGTAQASCESRRAAS